MTSATAVTTWWALRHGALRAKAFNPLFMRCNASRPIQAECPITLESRIWRIGRSRCSRFEMIVYTCMQPILPCRNCRGLTSLRHATVNSALWDTFARTNSLDLPPSDEKGASAMAPGESECHNDDDECHLAAGLHMRFEIAHPPCRFSAARAVR